jgi:hypothetical protein
MATSTNHFSTATPHASAAQAPAWAKRFAPSLFDLFLFSVLAWTFLASAKDFGWSQMLSDGDAGWHMRVGEWILSHGRVPTEDFFSFSKAGQPWFAWEWLSDVIFALAHGWMGLKGMVWLSAALFLALIAVIFRRVTLAGANIFVAVPLTMIAVGVIRIHLLARPHMFTLLFVALAVWLIDRDLKQPTRWIWALVPLTVLWTNLHGGWAALVAILAVVSAGAAAEALAGRRDWSAARRYAALAACCAAASLVNPYGWQLHLHMGAFLDSKWINEAVEEFQAPKFRGEGQRMLEIILICGLLAAGFELRRRRFIQPFLILFWTHATITSVRHAPILAIIAMPALATALASGWTRLAPRFKKSSLPGILNAVGRDMQPSISRPTLWCALPMLVLATPLLPMQWPANFPDEMFPVSFVERNQYVIVQSRLLTTDEWADYLLYRNYPRQRVFFDGRSDFYGERLGREFVRLINGHYDWDKLLKKHKIDAVMLPPATALSSLLKGSRQWRIAADSGHEVLFVLKGSAAENAAITLMARSGSAEVNGGETR